MKIISRSILFAACAALALATGCNISLFSTTSGQQSASPTRLYVLSVRESADESARLPIFSFSKISIPAYLDTPQIVTRDGDEISRSGKNLWGEPFARAVARTLPLRCYAAAGKISDGETLTEKTFPTVRVAIERLDGTLDGNVEIAADYRFQTEDGDALGDASARVFRASVPVEPRGDYTGYVRAINTALDRLAKDIAEHLQATATTPVPATDNAR